jgi:hypothetical protein
MSTKNALFTIGSEQSKILNKAYRILINNMFINLKEEDEYRLETYGLIVGEWIENNDQNSYDEFKYRITDGENINEIFIDIIEKNVYSTVLQITLIDRLKNYINEDKYKFLY